MSTEVYGWRVRLPQDVVTPRAKWLADSQAGWAWSTPARIPVKKGQVLTVTTSVDGTDTSNRFNVNLPYADPLNWDGAKLDRNGTINYVAVKDGVMSPLVNWIGDQTNVPDVTVTMSVTVGGGSLKPGETSSGMFLTAQWLKNNLNDWSGGLTGVHITDDGIVTWNSLDEAHKQNDQFLITDPPSGNVKRLKKGHRYQLIFQSRSTGATGSRGMQLNADWSGIVYKPSDDWTTHSFTTGTMTTDSQFGIYFGVDKYSTGTWQVRGICLLDLGTTGVGQ